MQPCAVAFDLDMTLVNVLDVKQRAFHAAAAAACAAPPADARVAPLAGALMRHAVGHGIDADDVVDAGLTARGVTCAVARARARFAFARAEHVAFPPFPGVRAALLTLAGNGHRLAVVTDAPRAKARARLAAARLTPFFDVLVTLEDTGAGKVDATPWRVAADRLGVAPERVLAVGDNPERDVLRAREAGCRTALARYGLTPVFANAALERLADHTLAAPVDVVRAAALTTSGTCP